MKQNLSCFGLFYAVWAVFFQYIEYHLTYINKNDVANTGGPLLTRFFETLEKQPCMQRSDLVLNGHMRVPK